MDELLLLTPGEKIEAQIFPKSLKDQPSSKVTYLSRLAQGFGHCKSHVPETPSHAGKLGQVITIPSSSNVGFPDLKTLGSL